MLTIKQFDETDVKSGRLACGCSKYVNGSLREFHSTACKVKGDKVVSSAFHRSRRTGPEKYPLRLIQQNKKYWRDLRRQTRRR